MSGDSVSVPMPLSMRDFSVAFSRHCDGFLARRSVLDSALFPEKPAQMCFGYEAVGGTLGTLTEWLDDRIDPGSLGVTLRQIRPPGPAILPTCALWMFHAALTTWSLQNVSWPDDVESVLSYWRRVYESQTARFDPPGGFLSGEATFQHLLLDETDVDVVVGQLDADAIALAAPMLAAAANYSWLLEAESRQGTYSHGLYPVDDGVLLVREFVDLGGSNYPWLPEDHAGLPCAPVSVALRLADTTGDFDIYGVPRLEPSDYKERVTGVAVLTADGWVSDPGGWLQDTTRLLRQAHVSLYRTVAQWTARQRLTAGARSYFSMWAPVVRLVGGTEDDVRRLLFDRLDAATPLLESYLERSTQPDLWRWAATRGDETLFAPVIRELT
jgi:hypothetical protein